MDNFIVFAALPDMGKVGGLVSKHLISELKAEKIADIRIFEKPWVRIQEGLITPVVDIFEIFFQSRSQGDNILWNWTTTRSQ